MKLRHIIYVIVAVVAISCSKEALKDDIGHLKELVNGIFTKGKGDGKAYRVYANGIDGTVTVGKEYTGTYADLTLNGEFSPCTVNAAGEFVEVDNTGASGLRAIDGPYKMHVVYPAIAMKPINGHNGINGYLFNRNLAQNEQPVYISNVINVNVNGVYVKEENATGQYIYDASELMLKQQRSKINITFKCGTSITSTTLQDITFKNVIDKGYYRPADGRFYYEADDVVSVDIYNPENAQTGLVLTTGESMKVVENQYILSMDYGEKDSQGVPKWPLPSFEIKTGTSSTQSVTFTAALGWNFLPQNTYDFTITINSMYVDILITASAWVPNNPCEGDISDISSWNITLPLEDGSEHVLEWVEIDGGTGKIE
ncbi:MAG: hypothetical protein IIX41_01490 [Bacteroidales bacterium]|nr:hypothetical protein [Bacteroidales bacterium]